MESFTVAVEVTTSGMTVSEINSTGNGEEYYFSADNGATWDSNADKTISTYTYGSDKISNASSVKVNSTGGVEISSATQFGFEYTGTYQPFRVLNAGNYKIELWGAAGGTRTEFADRVTAAAGAYTCGELLCKDEFELFFYVGESPGVSEVSTIGQNGGWNCGGKAGNSTYALSTGPVIGARWWWRHGCED